MSISDFVYRTFQPMRLLLGHRILPLQLSKSSFPFSKISSSYETTSPQLVSHDEKTSKNDVWSEWRRCQNLMNTLRPFFIFLRHGQAVSNSKHSIGASSHHSSFPKNIPSHEYGDTNIPCSCLMASLVWNWFRLTNDTSQPREASHYNELLNRVDRKWGGISFMGVK